MKVIIAQGNPEDKYSNTRHNIGFLALDYFVNKLNLSYKTSTKFKALYCEKDLFNEKVLFVKPLTYYNNTGEAAHSIMNFYKLKSSDFLVIHDELALDFLRVRVRLGGQDAGNNGIKSIIKAIGDKFWRVRIGIQDNKLRLNDNNFVLSKLSSEELLELKNRIFPELDQIIEDFIKQEIKPHSINLIKK